MEKENKVELIVNCVNIRNLTVKKLPLDLYDINTLIKEKQIIIDDVVFDLVYIDTNEIIVCQRLN